MVDALVQGGCAGKQAEPGSDVLGACAKAGYGDGAQKSVHPIEITDAAMFEQKVEYIHNNPVTEGLVTLPEHYAWSSAHAESPLKMYED